MTGRDETDRQVRRDEGPGERHAEERGAALSVRGLGLKGPRGWVFRGVDLVAEPGALVAVEGPSGSGRTCLLLALTGRMRTGEGAARVGGYRLPGQLAAVRRLAALGPVQDVSELDPALTVGEHLRERALLARRFGGLTGLPLADRVRPGRRRAAVAERAHEALAAAGLDLAVLPKGARSAVRDLERVEALRLSVALALLGRPRLLALDDIDLKLSDAARDEVWALLRSLAARGTTVLAVCGEAPADVQVLRTGAAPHPRTETPGPRPADRDEKGPVDDALPATGRS